MATDLPKLHDRKHDNEPAKPFLCEADVYDYLADRLSRQEADMRMIAIIADVIKDKDDGALLKDAPPSVRAAMIEPERQRAMLAKVGKHMRELATEHRLLDMRELDRARATTAERN